MKKFCQNCGNELADNAAMCVKCGKLLEEDTTNKNDSNKNKKMPIWLIVILIIVGIGIVSNISNNDSSENDTNSNSNNNSSKNDTNPNSNTNNNNNSVQKQEEIEYIKVSKDDLDDALEKNAAAAKDTYNKKYVEITGKLGTIDSDLSYISLVSSTNKYDFNGIYCRIKNKEQKEIVKTLIRDQEITIRGKITDVGEVLGYYLDITEIIT